MARYASSDERSKVAVKNIGISFIAKVLSVVANLLIVPLTLNYLNPTKYGIWLSLSQVIAWIGYMDFGLGNGFRNKFAEAKAKGQKELARQYLSTTFFTLGVLMLVVFSSLVLCNTSLDWSAILKIDPAYREELHTVFIIVCGFFCTNIVASLISTLLTADQKPGLSSLIYSAGQLLSLASIFILTKCTEESLTNLALYFSGVPCITMIFASIYAFTFTEYKKIKPAISQIRVSLIKDILGLGGQFFLIYLCLIAIFQVTNIVLSRELGPDAVTQYNIAFKYFNILYSVIIIIITPFWSACTDAYTKKDFSWMRKTLHNLEKIWGISIFAGVIMLCFSSLFYRIWIGDSVDIKFSLSAYVLVYMLLQSISNIYMYIINGIGTIRIQLTIYLLFALVSWPFLSFCCREFGVVGIVIPPALAYLVQAVLSKIQIQKILAGTAKGWWRK